MIKSFKYRLYPDHQQAAMIDTTISVCRLVYNLSLETKLHAWSSCGVRLSCYDLNYQLPGLRQEFPWIAAVDSHALRSAIKNMDNSFSNYFRGTTGFPKYKKKCAYGSFSCPENLKKVDWAASTISVPKIHNIRAVLCRKFDGIIKSITIRKTATGKYFASVLVNSPLVEITPPAPKNGIGIDLGIANFVILSTGEKIINPKYLANKADRLRILNRRASRKKKGGKNRRKANLRVAILQERITNQRSDFLHKLSTKIIRDNQADTICVESLSVSNMVKNHSLAQSILDASWSEFIRQLQYKGKWYGKNVIKIDKWFASSKTCSNCGHVLDQLNLSVREWTCGICNSTHDRDINAAINIRNSGMGSPGEPVEFPSLEGAVKQEQMSRKIIY